MLARFQAVGACTASPSTTRKEPTLSATVDAGSESDWATASAAPAPAAAAPAAKPAVAGATAVGAPRRWLLLSVLSSTW